MNELSEMVVEKTMTTKELAEVLGVDVKTIQRVVASLDMNVERVGSSHTMVFNEQQATLIKIELQNHSKVAQNGFTSMTISNDLEMLLMQQKLNEYQSMRIEELTRQNELLKPKAQVYERISDSTGYKTVGETAKLLGVGEKTLFATLRGMGVFFKDNGCNQVKQQYVNSGYFVTKESPYTQNGINKLYSRIFVTAKGLLWLEEKIR